MLSIIAKQLHVWVIWRIIALCSLDIGLHINYINWVVIRILVW